MRKFETNGFVKINKTKARKLFNEGKEIHLLPCKVCFGTMWLGEGSAISNKRLISSFDAIVNEYEFYNCNNELGKYAAYYIKK